MEPLAGVGLVMALLFGTAWIAVRKKNGLPLLGISVRAATSDRRLVLVERLPLTAHHALYLVQLEGSRLLVATHPQGVAFCGPTTETPAFPAVFAGAVAMAAGQEPPPGGR